MSSVIPKGGPCYLSEWPCHESFLPCYKDCCKRGSQFCNHRVERCQDCSHREKECGNYSMPYECDVFCHKATHPSLNKAVDMVPTDYNLYKASTYILSGVVIVLLAALGLTCYCKRRQQRPSPPVSDTENISLMESTISGSSTEDKQVQTEEYSTPVQYPNPSMPAMCQGKMPAPCGFSSSAYEKAPPQARESLHPLGHNARPPDVATTSESHQDHSSLAEATLENPAREYHDPSSNGAYAYTARVMPDRPPPLPSSLHAGQSNGVCHDPRLDNIPPSDDGSRDVYMVHRGQAAIHGQA